MKKKKVAVILNGCGHRDGSEIHEAVLTLLGIEEAGAAWECLAPDHDQAAVVDHRTGNVIAGEHRSMLLESARIARGHIRPLTTVAPQDYDAVIVPGGSGTAKNLCNFATAGGHMEVEVSVADFLKGAHKLGRPLGAICISPVILGRLFGEKGLRLTLGSAANDAAKAARGWGAEVVDAGPGDVVVDHKLKIATTPAYMCDAAVADVAVGIRKLARAVVEMA